jgi:hypothetical protein
MPEHKEGGWAMNSRTDKIEEIIRTYVRGGRINSPQIAQLAEELNETFKPSGSKRWGVYRNEGGVLEPVKTGFKSKKEARAWWQNENGVANVNVAVKGTKVGYMHIDLSGTTGPVLIRED